MNIINRVRRTRAQRRRFSKRSAPRSLRVASASGVVAAMLCVPPAGAQTPLESIFRAQETPADTVAPDAAVEPIPIADIPSRAEESIIELRAIRAQVRPDPTSSRIAAEFPAEVEELNRLMRETTADLAQVSARRVEDMRQQWLAHGSLVRRWEEELRQRSASLAHERENLRSIRKEWEATIGHVAADELPPAVVGRVQSVTALADTVEVQIGERLTALLTLQDRLSARALDVAEMLARVDAAGEGLRHQLFVRESPSLWQAIRGDSDAASLSDQMRDSWRGNVEKVVAYVTDRRGRIGGQAALLGILLVLALALYWRSRRWTGADDVMQTAAHMARRPVSLAVLLTLLFTPRFHPRAPIAFVNLIELLAIAPVLRLLPPKIYQQLGRPIFGAAVLYAFDQLYQIALGESVLARLVLLTITFGALVGAASLLRSTSRLSALRVERVWDVVFQLLRVASVLLAISTIANLLGNVTLAELLTEGTLGSAFIALGSYAVATVLGGLWRLLLGTRVARRLNIVNRHADLVTRRGLGLIRLAAIAFWAWATLSAFWLWDSVVTMALAALDRPFTLGTITISLGDVLAFFAVLFIASILSRTIRFVLAEDVLPRTRLPRGLPGSISTVVHYLILTAGFLIALAAAGIELNRVALLAGAFGVGIGFGLQDIVRNFVSGLILAFERPIGVGDVVQVGTLFGKVRRIGARSSTIRTYDGSEVIVPNANLTAAEVINWTLSDSLRRLEVPVGVSYGTDPQLVQDLLVAVVKDNPEVLNYPEPVALFVGFGESALNFLLRFWIADVETSPRISSEVTAAVDDRLKQAGITIPFPQRDVHLRSALGPSDEAATAAADEPALRDRETVRSGRRE